MSAGEENNCLEICIMEAEEFSRDPGCYLSLVSGNLFNREPISSYRLSIDNGDLSDGEIPREVRLRTCQEVKSLKSRLLGTAIFGEPVAVPSGIGAMCGDVLGEKAKIFIVNTDHPEIKMQLNKIFKRAKKFIEKGERFCIKVDFQHVLKDWFHKVGVVDEDTEFSLSGAEFYVTNFGVPLDLSPRPGCCPTVFYRPVVFILLVLLLLYFVAWIIAYPLYNIFRYMLCKDEIVAIKANVSAPNPLTQEQREDFRRLRYDTYPQHVPDIPPIHAQANQRSATLPEVIVDTNV